MPRTTVFVSYSHTDRAWLDRLRVQLKPLEREGRIELWDDTRIAPGSSWRDEIRRALDSAKVAVLLVSADFLASQFIAENELPPLLKAAREAGAVILPVIVSPCLYTDTEGLKEFQAVNDPQKPLVSLKKAGREQVFLTVARAVKESLSKETASDATRTRPTPWPGTMRRPDSAGLSVWGAIDGQTLRRIQPLEILRSTGHSILQKCALDDELFVLKGTRADLCDLEALRQLVPEGPRPVPIGTRGVSEVDAMGTPRAVWTNDQHVWELQPHYVGRSLADVVAERQKPLTGPALLAVVEAMANVLEFLHARELIHRDINPGNVLDVGSAGLRIIDWSFCCRASGPQAQVATPGYTAPEQAAGRAECASDWYSLGATCFALANGFTPHERGQRAFKRGLAEIHLGAGEFRGWPEEEFFGLLLDPDPKARPKPWESNRKLFDIRRDSQPGPRTG